MGWSIGEYLNLIELRGLNWCFINMGARSGFRLPHSEALFFHAFFNGPARMATGAGQVTDCRHGDMIFVLPGETHKIRNEHGRTAPTIDLLTGTSGADFPVTIQLGTPPIANSLLSGRLDIIWPGGLRPAGLPTLLPVPSGELGIDFATFSRSATGPGGSAILTRMANLLFAAAFRSNAACRAQLESSLHDPIARARVLIEKNPFEPWQVETLAARVGMGRSNFATRFTSELGKTPINLLNEERMKHAEALLRSTNFNIAEISERLGYRSEATFIRRFTANFGMTPGKWRREQQQV